MPRPLVKPLSIIVLLALVCAFIFIGIPLVQRASAEQQIEQQLAVLDTYFDTTRTSIPSSGPDEILFSAQVGNFKRVDLGRSTKSDCGWNVHQTQLCFTAVYASNQDYPQIWLKAGEINRLSIEDRVGSMLCSSTLNGELRLRIQHPYLYLVCLPQFQTGSSIYGFSWQNGKWFIGLLGDYEHISQFIAAYPY